MDTKPQPSEDPDDEFEQQLIDAILKRKQIVGKSDQTTKEKVAQMQAPVAYVRSSKSYENTRNASFKFKDIHQAISSVEIKPKKDGGLTASLSEKQTIRKS